MSLSLELSGFSVTSTVDLVCLRFYLSARFQICLSHFPPLSFVSAPAIHTFTVVEASSQSFSVFRGSDLCTFAEAFQDFILVTFQLSDCSLTSRVNRLSCSFVDSFHFLRSFHFSALSDVCHLFGAYSAPSAVLSPQDQKEI